ncbi:hypothetical protein F2Q70_00036138 [Brassica cretica]|uniref:Uncharacterized protein n=1 Tax=Brassica cretica TaxID=69181 RepID=A0A8S9JUQ4_BRACR|nr:hypothetical protein F2Q70_00036138 [Brassica cretica]
MDELDGVIGVIGPTRQMDDLDGVIGPTRPFGELDCSLRTDKQLLDVDFEVTVFDPNKYRSKEEPGHGRYNNLMRSPSYLVTSSGEFSCWCKEDIEIGRAAMVSIEIPRIMDADWGGGADSHGRLSHRAGVQCPPSDSPSPTPSRSDAACTPSDRVGEGVAKSSPSNRDVESERVVGRSSGLSPTTPLGGESVCDGNSLPPTVPSVDRPSFMADAIHSSSGRGGYRGSDSLKRHLDDVIPEEAAGKKPRKNPYDRVFRYNGDTPFVNDERACAEYYCGARNPFFDIMRTIWFMLRNSRTWLALMPKAKLETMFSEKQTRDDKIKELEVVAKELASAVETATARAESLQANLFASISREAILRAQVGDQQNSLGARITYLERSRDDYVAQEVARAVRAAIAKYRG